ncbi:MAG: hypothetical protein WCC00_10105 [Candidatus Aminicenantales bacterium]
MKKIKAVCLGLRLLFCLVLFITVCGSCKKDKSDLMASNISDTVINGESPAQPSLRLEFVEELSIINEGWWQVTLDVDEIGNIYICDETEGSIRKYGPEGNLLLEKIFKKGQGPGDFNFMDLHCSSDGLVYVFDQRVRRLSVLNRDLTVQSTRLIDGSCTLRMDSSGNLFLWRFDGEEITATLTKYFPSGRVVGKMFEIKIVDPQSIPEKSTFVWPLYLPQTIYKLDSDDNIYFCTTDKYEITVVSPDGRQLKKIVKKGQTRRFTVKDRDMLPSAPAPANGFRTEYLAPENVPPVADFFILEDHSLLVLTHENAYDDRMIAGDLFNSRGDYLNRVQVPRYYLWNFVTHPLGKKMALYKNGNFYTIEANEAEDRFFVKKYRVREVAE